MAPWWPEGHYNRGLVLGHLKMYSEGIRELTRYLLLVPTADDAQAVKKTIYVWEDLQPKGASPKQAEALLEVETAAAGAAAQAETRFLQIAKAYREAATKPTIPEEAHKFDVQALAAVNEKHFRGAADSYRQALKIALWWPEEHFNLALALAGINDFGGAVAEMRRYLTLVPDAPDARAAQDRINEWEEWERKVH